jgi:ferric-dicitrate binding protein FerR (iron transport regulator)
MTVKKIYPILGAFGLLLVVLGMYSWLMPDANWQGLKAISGESKSIRLPDSSMAYLKGPAEIGYPSAFDKKVRNLKMEGEVYFEVVNNRKSFLVQTEKGGVETRGAKFLINSKEKKNITVHCLMNKVRMIAKGKKEILEINLEAGEMCSFTKGDGQMQKETFDAESFMAKLLLSNFDD